MRPATRRATEPGVTRTMCSRRDLAGRDLARRSDAVVWSAFAPSLINACGSLSPSVCTQSDRLAVYRRTTCPCWSACANSGRSTHTRSHRSRTLANLMPRTRTAPLIEQPFEEAGTALVLSSAIIFIVEGARDGE